MNIDVSYMPCSRRLAQAVKDGGGKLALLNVGPTRADNLADLKIEAVAGEALMALATHPTMLLPRI